MSAEALSKLSLGETMVTTRAGAARARTAPPQRSHSPSTSSASSSELSSPSPSAPIPTIESVSPTPSTIEAASGLTYNVSAFDTDVRRRAKRGLMDDHAIKMKYCRVSDDDQGEFLFDIEDEITIAMGGRYSVPRCTCGANEGGRACKHIFWMIDQLTAGAPEKIKSQTLNLAIDGSSVHNMKPARMIDHMHGLGIVAKELDWVLHEGPIPEVDEIEDDIAEILSVFDPDDALPSEFKSPESPYLSEEARKFREFKDLFVSYASDNLGLYNRLQTVIDPAFQAEAFFKKINERITGTFKALEEYIDHGPTAASSEAYDVVTCADKLKHLVGAIDQYYHQQEDGEDVATKAAAALINILDGVTSRNFDAYANITWDGIPPEHPEQMNLFVALIGAPAAGDGLFVLDALESLPHDAFLRNHWGILRSIRDDRLLPQWTPQPYLEAFHAIMTENRKRAASETAGSSAKRAVV